jgi:hypothetical protein
MKIDLTPKRLYPATARPTVEKKWKTHPKADFGKPAKAAPWTGVDWSQSVARAGCQDFLKCPSRRGDELHEWKAPLLNASSVKPPMKVEK